MSPHAFIFIIMEQTNPNGILIVDKPSGLTSHDVVNIIRRLFKIKKVGHAGTLDPIATGVLVVLLGGATKRSNLLSNDDKEYAVNLQLGISTDTGDALGKILRSSRFQGLDKNTIKKTVLEFVGEIEQIPPMFSAIKFKGKSLYKWARKGITVPRESRKVTIKNIFVKEISPPRVAFDILCSKGTYIRQLCVDIGEKLGCGAHMTGLRRTRSGNFYISQAISVDRLKGLPEEELYNALIRF